MAIDLCSESFGFGFGLGMSPRISFSHDLCQTDIVPVEQHQPHLESTSDFDFCLVTEQGSSSADELFSDGKILPLQIRKKTTPPPPPPPSPPPPKQVPLPPVNVNPTENLKKGSLKEIMATTTSDLDEKPPSKSFWRFTRSTSCGGNGYKQSLICSLSLLSRSNSTGSALNPKRPQPPLSKDNSNPHRHSQKQHPSTATATATKQSSSSSSSSFSSYCSSQRPPLKSNYGGLYGNGVRISPVLNVPPPYISKGTANLLGLGLFFCNGNDKKKKQKQKQKKKKQKQKNK